MPTTETRGTDGEIWRRLLDPENASLSPEAARFLVVLDFPPGDKGRMRELAAKARAGTLTAEEQQEVDSYGRVGSVLGILQSRARKALRQSSRPNRSAP
jgi:hypothetical protein